MLRLINVQTKQAVEREYIGGKIISLSQCVVCDVVDVDKQETLGQLAFTTEGFGNELLHSKGDERTRLTTITGATEKLMREYFGK